MGATWTEAQARASAAYEEKTNKQFQFKLRLDEDADIIADIEESMAHGIKKREWMRDLFNGSGVSLQKVKSVLESNGIDPDTVNKIIYELKK